jgi:hypothetical protein
MKMSTNIKSEGQFGGEKMKEIVLMVTCGGAAATDDDLRRKTTVLYRQTDAGQQVATHSKRSHHASMFKLLK